MTPALEVRDLRTEFPTRSGLVRAVNGVSFAIPRGRILGLVGESGSGKSVTGFSIIGLVDPPGRVTAGTILLEGEDISHFPPEAMVGSSRVDLQACKLEYSIVSPK